jgi:hypothetical protein
MSAISETPRVASAALWIGRVLSGLVIVFLLLGLYVGLMAWGGLYLRDSALRALVPWR